MEYLRRTSFVLTISMVSLGFCSCEDKELEAERAAQEKMITGMKQELAELKKQLVTDPGDQSSKLKKAEKKVQTVRQEIKKFRTEVDRLHSEKQNLEAEFVEYQKRYKIPN